MTNENTPKLLPCPFCGGDAEFERLGTRMQSTIVACQFCGATQECGETYDYGDVWNTRTAPTSDTHVIISREVLELMKQTTDFDIIDCYSAEEQATILKAAKILLDAVRL